MTTETIDTAALAKRVDDLEEAVRLAEVGEYLLNACLYSGGDGYTEPREMGIEWQWQQSAPDQYGQGMLLAAATKWHDEQAEDGVITEARQLRASIASHTPAQPSEPAKAEVVDAALWCAHVRGPDDVAAAASYDDAVALCDQINAIAKAYAHLDVMVVAYPALWPWDAQSHAANLAKGNGYRGPTLATTPTAPAAAAYHIPKPECGWKQDFSADERSKLRPIAETLAMLDGNAFFGLDTRLDWHEAYLPEAHALYEANGGDTGWAGRASFAAPAAARSAAEAKMHAVNLEQCSIFVDSNPIKRAMTDAAAFIRALPLPGEEA